MSAAVTSLQRSVDPAVRREHAMNDSWSSSVDENDSTWTGTLSQVADSLFGDDYSSVRKRGLRYVPTGESRNVQLYVEPQADRHRPGMSLCERLLGIMPGRFTRSDADAAGPTKNLVLVETLIPGRQAYRSGRVAIHDWLVAINDLEVRWETLETILSAVASPMKVKLTLQKMAIDGPQHAPAVVGRTGLAGGQSLISALGADRTIGATAPAAAGQQLAGAPTNAHYTVMYLTLETSESSGPTEDLLYCFPRPECELVTLRGLFLTLCNVMADLSGSGANVSSLVHRGTEVHVGYVPHGRELLVITVPAAAASVDLLSAVLEGVSRVLSFCYESLHSAFATPANKCRLDMFFSLLERRLTTTVGAAASGTVAATSSVATNPAAEMQASGSSGASGSPSQINVVADCEHSLDAFPSSATLWLPVPEESKLKFDDILSGLESADFGDMADDYYGLRRMYTLLGCCAFYKGHVVANHLPAEDLADISTYAKFYGLLDVSRSRAFENIVIWREVFPTRRRPDGHSKWAPSPGYNEPDGRTFMLISALGHGALAVLLEAGGCATRVTGYPAPDPFYVNQVQQALLELEASAGYSSVCEHRLRSPAPPLASPDAFVTWQGAPAAGISPMAFITKKFSAAAGKETKQRRNAGGGQPSPHMQQPSVAPSSRWSNDQVVSPWIGSGQSDNGGGDSNESTTSLGSASPPGTPGPVIGHASDLNASSSSSSLYIVPSRQRRVISALPIVPDAIVDRSKNAEAVATETAFEKLTRLTGGPENTLFHYVSFDSSQGVIVAPAVTRDSATGHGRLQADVIDNFFRCCTLLRPLLRKGDNHNKGNLHGRASTIDANSHNSAVVEHGVLFRCQSGPPSTATSSSKSRLSAFFPAEGSSSGSGGGVGYWVVGRRMVHPTEHELYVCFHESVQESAVELAFKMTFGALL